MRSSTTASWALLFLLFSVGVARAADPVPISGIAGASFRAVDLEEMRKYYGKGAGFRELGKQKSGALRFGVGQDQWLEFLPGGVRGYVIRFDSLTLNTPSLKALEANLRARGVTVNKGEGKSLEIRDNTGYLLRFVEPAAKKSAAPAKLAPGFSQHLQHIGVAVHHNEEEKAISFYRDTLGLEETFRMKDKGGRPTLVKFRLPGERPDIIELIFVWGPMNKWGAGSIFHVNFAVDKIEDAYCHLFKRGVVDEDRHFPKVNAERLWAVDMIDPEFTRVEIQVLKHATEEIGASLNPACSGPSEEIAMFNGKNLDGWSGEIGYWRVEDGMIIGESKTYMHYNTFLWHDSTVLKDFYLSVHIKQTPSRDRNSGIQFRSHHIDQGVGALGYQADVGTALWGRLYHEEGRQHMFRLDTGEKAVDWEGWNHYEILAVGHRIWTAVNGTLSVAVEDPKGELTGKLALQIHFDPQQLVRFKDLKVIRNPPVSLAGRDEAALVKALRPVKEEAGR